MSRKRTGEICRDCLITKAVSKKDQHLLKKADFMSVDKTENNVILKEILNHPLSKGQRFTIVVTGNRYGIKVLERQENTFFLTQEYLHLDSRNKRLVSVNIRCVKIKI